MSAAPFYLCCYGTLRDPGVRKVLLGQRADELYTRSGWVYGTAHFVSTASGEESPRTGASFEPWPTFTPAEGVRLPVTLLTGPSSLLFELLPLIDEYEEGYQLERRTAWLSQRGKAVPLLVHQYRGMQQQGPSLRPWSLEAFQPFRAALIQELVEERVSDAYTGAPPSLNAVLGAAVTGSASTLYRGAATEAFLWHQEQLAYQPLSSPCEQDKLSNEQYAYQRYLRKIDGLTEDKKRGEDKK